MGKNKKLVYKLFKTWPRKTSYIPRVVKWKCEKEIVHLVHDYSVTGREPRKNVLKINLLLSWTIFLFFQRYLPFSCYMFSQVIWRLAHNIKNDVLTFRIWLIKLYNKSHTRLFDLSKQTFLSHVSEVDYCIIYSFIPRQYRNSRALLPIIQYNYLRGPTLASCRGVPPRGPILGYRLRVPP